MAGLVSPLRNKPVSRNASSTVKTGSWQGRLGLLSRWFFYLAMVFVAFKSASMAQVLVPVPKMSGRLVDLTGTLGVDEAQAITALLKGLEAEKGSQVAVLMVPTSSPENIEAFSMRVVEDWKLGREKVDDGVLFVIAKNDRTMRIEVGYGLEGVLTDAFSRRILDDSVTPKFKVGDFAGGIASGVNAISQAIRGEKLPEPLTQIKPIDYEPTKVESAEIEAFNNRISKYASLLAYIGIWLGVILGPLKGSLITFAAAVLVGYILFGHFIGGIVIGLIIFVVVFVISVFLWLMSKLISIGSSSRSGGSTSGGGYRGGGGGGSFGGGGASGSW